MADELKFISKNLSKVSKTTRSNTKGITLHSYADWYGNKSQYNGFDLVQSINTTQENYGFHYLLDEYDIVETIDPKFILNPWNKKKPTYISTSLYTEKPEDNTISVCVFIDTTHDYEKTEQLLIKLLSQLLDKYKLKSDDIWRGYDLSKDDKGPVQYLDTDIFKKLLKQVDAYMAFTADSANDDKEFDFESPFKTEGKTVDDVVKNLLETNKDKIDNYIGQFEPWDKDKAEIKDAKKDPTVGSLKTKTYPTKNILQYKITSIPPGGGLHCKRAADKLDGIESEEDTFVEPIYPDLITPPGGQINVSNGNYDTKVQSNSTTAITVEDFEKRQKTFDLSNFSNIKKETAGRPINTDDPFPVDEQIKKLEEHFPKVKIDKTTFDFTEDNHPGSVIGKAMAKNYAMCYDMVNEISKRTEKRLVKIENNLSTVMRNLFRMSSRVNINCVYYGGQSVYGKYKCIRCLHDNRLDDGAIVSMDQCLCCTRYEPILGQVYAILDETGSNVSQVVDDLQMAYMDLPDYSTFNNVNEYAIEPKTADLKKDSTTIPEEFRDRKWADTKEEKRIKAELKAKRLAAAKTSGEVEEPKRDEKILIHYDDIKQYLNNKLEEVIVIDGDNKQVTRDEYIILKKYEFIKVLTENIPKDPDDKKYYDDNGNVLTRDKYIELVTNKLKDSYINDDYFNGFKMDWTPSLLETHKPNVNAYDTEALKNGKTNIIGNSDHQPEVSRDLFIDSRESAIEYEKLEFNVKDYEIEGFGNCGSGTDGSYNSGAFGMGASQVRQKIVDYAKKAVDLCAEGKAFYDQGQRMLHDDKAVNGISYWDCSSLVEAAYQSAGVTGVTGTTATEYPACLDTAGGLLIPVAEIDKALPGDMIWCYSLSKPTTQDELQSINYNDGNALYHVGIYIGDGKYAHASGHNSTPNIKISDVSGNTQLIAFGRPKDLIELDRSASQGASGPGVWNRESQGIDDALWSASSVADEQVPEFIKNMGTYGYKDYIINTCKEFNFDPYVLAAMITIETTGNPNEGSTYKGLLQVEGGSSDPATNIRQALTGLMARKPALINAGWSENNIHCLVSAHNSGEGTVTGAAKASNINLASCKISEMGNALYDYVKTKHSNWDPNEKKTYSTKVLRAYGLLYQQKALG